LLLAHANDPPTASNVAPEPKQRWIRRQLAAAGIGVALGAGVLERRRPELRRSTPRLIGQSRSSTSVAACAMNLCRNLSGYCASGREVSSNCDGSRQSTTHTIQALDPDRPLRFDFSASYRPKCQPD
jgi:hypothetical protein